MRTPADVLADAPRDHGRAPRGGVECERAATPALEPSPCVAAPRRGSRRPAEPLGFGDRLADVLVAMSSHRLARSVVGCQHRGDVAVPQWSSSMRGECGLDGSASRWRTGPCLVTTRPRWWSRRGAHGLAQSSRCGGATASPRASPRAAQSRQTSAASGTVGTALRETREPGSIVRQPVSCQGGCSARSDAVPVGTSG